MRTYDKEASSDHDGLHPDVQVHGKLDAKVIRVRERLSQEACPLFADLADLVGLVHGKDLG